MYYLRSKLVAGYVGDDLERDARESPGLIVYCKFWQNFKEIFHVFFDRAACHRESFPVLDYPANNLPELNRVRHFTIDFGRSPGKRRGESSEADTIRRNAGLMI